MECQPGNEAVMQGSIFNNRLIELAIDEKKLKVSTTMLLIVLTTGFFTLFYYPAINYLLFGDFGFIPSGRIVFASKFGYFDYHILPLELIFGMRIYRNQLSDTVNFNRLFKFSFITATCASICFSAFVFICLQSIEPDDFYKLTDLIGLGFLSFTY